MVAAPLSIVRASAGSGKTFTLALEYCKAVLKNPESYNSILAVTFTNKATGEMKRRIVEELAGLSDGRESKFMSLIVEDMRMPVEVVARRAQEALTMILTDYSSFSVMTIDTFFQRIIRSFFRELGLDMNYTVQIESRAAMDKAVERLVERSAEDKLLRQLIERVVGERLDKGSSWDVLPELRKLSSEIFREEYREPQSTTTELIAVFAALKKEYDQSLDLLRQHATRACDLIRGAGLSPHDFKYGRTSFAHYLFKIERGEAIEKYGARFASLPQEPTTAYTDKTILKDQIISILPDLVASVAAIIELYDSTLVVRSTFESIAVNFSKYLLLGHLKRSFQQVLNESGELSIAHTTQFIDDIARSASIPFIFEKLGNRYTTIFIDEFQDTSRGQWRGFLPLLHEAISKAEQRRVMLIGDVKQAIYRWRGGDWNILSYLAEQEFGQKVDDSLVLNTSYRSERCIVEFNNALIRWVVAGAQNHVADFLKGDKVGVFDELISALARAYMGREQQVAESKMEPPRGFVEVSLYDNVEDSLQTMVANIEDALQRGYRAGELAVLVRTRAEGVAVAKFLVERGFSIMSDEVLLLKNSPTVNFVINLFRYSNSGSAIARAALNRYLGRGFTDDFSDDELLFVDSLRSMSSVAAMEGVIRFFELQTREVAYLQGLYDLVYQFSIKHSSSIGEFIGFWDENCDKSSLALSQSEDAINILTIHKAKGLEFACVFLPFASWSFVPSANPATRLWVVSDAEPYDVFNPIPVNYTSQLADGIYRSDFLREGVYSVVDNINLLYVALTRASRELYVSIPEQTTKNSIATFITAALGAMEWTGSVGCREVVSSAKEDMREDNRIIFSRLESYAQRVELDLELREQRSDPGELFEPLWD